MTKYSSNMGFKLFMPHKAKDEIIKMKITSDIMETLNFKMNKLNIDQLKLNETSDMNQRIPVTNGLQAYIKRVSKPVEYEVEEEESVRETISNPLILDQIKQEESENESIESNAKKSNKGSKQFQPSAVTLVEKESSQLGRIIKRLASEGSSEIVAK